jgi:hypothetical protein
VVPDDQAGPAFVHDDLLQRPEDLAHVEEHPSVRASGGEVQRLDRGEARVRVSLELSSQDVQVVCPLQMRHGMRDVDAGESLLDIDIEESTDGVEPLQRQPLVVLPNEVEDLGGLVDVEQTPQGHAGRRANHHG